MIHDYAHERPIRYEQDAEGGLWYIRELSAEDAKKLFDKAHNSDSGITHFTHRDFGYILAHHYPIYSK